MQSGECYNDIVGMFENATGGNAPSANLISAFQYNLANGIWSQTDCQNWLAGVGSQINGVYESVLGRAADPGALAWGLNQVVAGVSLTTITQEVASSGECYNDIVGMFENATGGNAPSANLISAFQIQSRQWHLVTDRLSKLACGRWLADQRRLREHSRPRRGPRKFGVGAQLGSRRSVPDDHHAGPGAVRRVLQ